MGKVDFVHITEIPVNSPVVITASIGKNSLNFNSKMVDINERNILIEIIKNEEGQPVSLASDKITVDLSYFADPEKPPFVWHDVKANYVRKNNTPYQQIVQSADAKRENRRGAYRLFIGEPATVSMVDKQGSIQVILKDISTTGFGFVHTEEIELNKFCRIACTIDNQKIVLSGNIVRRQNVEKGKIIYGCRLDRFSKELEKFINTKQREEIRKKMG